MFYGMTKEEYDSRFIIETEPKKTKYKKILSVDIGIKHLCLSLSYVDKNYNFIKVKKIKLIDIQNFVCDRDCQFFHTKTPADWLSHVFYNHYKLFDCADHVLIEKQPPDGLVMIEQLMFLILREKAELIYPRSVHAYFGMTNISSDRDTNYEKRKENSILISQKFLSEK